MGNFINKPVPIYFYKIIFISLLFLLLINPFSWLLFFDKDGYLGAANYFLLIILDVIIVLPYFYNRKKHKLFKSAFVVSENIAFGILIRLIKYEGKRKYLKSLNRQQTYYKSGGYQKLRYHIFSIFPFNYTNYLYTRFKSC